jgi:hypothetical protein
LSQGYGQSHSSHEQGSEKAIPESIEHSELLYCFALPKKAIDVAATLGDELLTALSS